MEASKAPSSRFLCTTVLDVKDDLDEKLEWCYGLVTSLTQGLSEREANDALQNYVAKGPMQHDDVELGFFYSILTEPSMAAKSYRDMSMVCRDSLNKALHLANQIVYEKWTKLAENPRTQLLWFARELVRNAVNGADSVCHSLIRQIAGGDISPKNIWLTDALLDIFIENRTWLDKYAVMLPIALYTYLRVIVDHGGANFAALRQKEVDFCISLLREKWVESSAIGRDLLRLLQYVARIPEFESLWRDILHNPSAVNPQFTGIQQLMAIRTSKRYFISRLTPDMENKLVFLTSKVKFGQHKRYQEWFQRQYLATPESQSLRCDLIRYICTVIHPSNEVLCSDIIPRWAVIGWLLTTCTSNVAATNAKLSLFFDWMSFNKAKDSIMNIEPCILVMHHSMRPHPAITATLLDFMCRVMINFYPAMDVPIKQCVFSSLNTILEKKVLPSLSPLFDNPKLDRELRTMLREHFKDFCSAEAPKDEPSTNNKVPEDLEPEMNSLNDSSGMSEMAEFSEEEEEEMMSIGPEKVKIEREFRPIRPPVRTISVDVSDEAESLEGELKDCVMDLQQEVEPALQCEMMDRTMQAVIRQEDFDQEMASVLATCLCKILESQFNNKLFPQETDEESLEDSIGTPLFVIFRNVCGTSEEDPIRQPLMLILEEMYNKQSRIGYHFLYFLKASKVQTDSHMAPYKDFCGNMESRDLNTCLMTDLKVCQEDDVRLFTYLIPDIFFQFPNFSVGNAELLHVIVSCIDGTQLQDLICEILMGHLVMFRKDSFLLILNASLDWETIEQYFLWQLIAAHNIPVEHIMPILPKLEFSAHAEALSSIMIQLKQEQPAAELLRLILCRECKRTDLFTVSVMKHWAQEYEDRLAELLLAQLTRNNSTPNRKRHRQHQSSGNKAKDKEKEQPSVEQVLSHLEHMRQTCRNISFLTNEYMQQALQHIQTSCSDAQKNKYSDLLALVEDFDELRTTRVLRAVPSRRASAAAATTGRSSNSRNRNKVTMDDSDSLDESTEDEEIPRPKSKKPRKTPALIDEDD